MDPSPESCHMRIFQLYRESAGLVLAIDIVAKCEDIINLGRKISIDENCGERKNPSANPGVCVLASVWMHVCVCVRGVGVCMQTGFSMTCIFVRFDAHLDQMTQINITTASCWTQSCVRSTCF